MKIRIFLAVAFLLLGITRASAQTTAFTYQGKLTDNGSPANGNYDLQFSLFDSASAGAQIGQSQTVTNVSASGGAFTVKLDFGANAFPGASRFLEISTRPSGGGAFTLLTPRQPITSTPYAVRSLNAASADTATSADQLGHLPASTYVLTVDPRLSDPRPPTSGSSNYIQNGNSLQAGSNFNISGNGTVAGTLSGNVVNAGQYNLGGAPLMSMAGSFLQVGGPQVGAGPQFVFDNNVGIGTFDLYPSDTRLLSVGGKNAALRLAASSPVYLQWEWLATGTALNLSNYPSSGIKFNALTVLSGGQVGIGTLSPVTKLDVDGGIRFSALSSGGATQLCRNNSTGLIATCSSSLRYKTDLHPFSGGLNLVNRLQPITFKWKNDQSLDLGLGAEDVAAVEPLLVTHNEKGEVEGVKYDRLSAVFINAFKEQQAQIEQQQSEAKLLKATVEQQRVAAKRQQDQIAFLRTANDSLNARLRTIEKALKRQPAIRRRR